MGARGGCWTPFLSLCPCSPGLQRQAGCGLLSDPAGCQSIPPHLQTLPGVGWEPRQRQSPFAGAVELSCACTPREQLPALLEPGQSQSTLRAQISCRSLCGAQPDHDPTLPCWTPLPLPQPLLQTRANPSYLRGEQGGMAAGGAPSPEPGSSQTPHPSGCCPVGSVESNKQRSIPAPMISPAHQDIV